MAVGEYEAIWREHDSRAGPARRAWRSVAAMGGEADHRGPDPVDHVDDGAGIGVKECPIFEWDGSPL